MGDREQERRFVVCMRLLSLLHLLVDHLLSGHPWKDFVEYEEALAQLRKVDRDRRAVDGR